MGYLLGNLSEKVVVIKDKQRLKLCFAVLILEYYMLKGYLKSVTHKYYLEIYSNMDLN